MSHVKQSDINHTHCLTDSGTGPLPAWAEMLLRVHHHISLNSPMLSRIALRAVLNHLVDDIDRYAYCLGVVGADSSSSARGPGQLYETLYVMQEGEGFHEKNAYPVHGEFEALGLKASEARKRFYQALGRLNNDHFRCFSEPGRSAYVISLADITVGVVCPGDGYGAKRIVVHRTYCEPFMALCRELGLIEVLFAQSDELAGHGCCTVEHLDQDAYSGVAAEIDARFSPELIEHDVPAHVLSGFKRLARRFDANPLAWQAMSHSERLQINRDRVRYLVLPQMFTRYGLEEGAAADVLRLIGLADRILGDDIIDLGGISTVLDQMEAVLSDHEYGDSEMVHGSMARLAILKTLRSALPVTPDHVAADRTGRSRLHHFLIRVARRACQDPLLGSSC